MISIPRKTTFTNNMRKNSSTEINQRKDFQITKYILIAALVVAVLGLTKDSFNKYLKEKKKDILLTIIIGTTIVGLPIMVILLLYAI